MKESLLSQRKTPSSYKRNQMKHLPKVATLTIALSLVLSLQACSSKDIVASSQTIVVAPSDSLLIHPCKATPPGESLLALAQGYNSNVECVGLYKLQIEKIKKNKQDKLFIYKQDQDNAK